jgi:hypothetical protein
LKKFIKDESGSISLLLVFLFLVTAIISLVVIDISDGYLAKRQLAQVGEAAAQIGSHQIDLNRYYSQGLIDSGMGYKQVPLDCNSAINYALRFLNSNSLRGNPIRLTGASCQNEKVTLNIQSEIRPLITLPIVTGTFGQRFLINSKVITTAVVR